MRTVDSEEVEIGLVEPSRVARQIIFFKVRRLGKAAKIVTDLHI